MGSIPSIDTYLAEGHDAAPAVRHEDDPFRWEGEAPVLPRGVEGSAGAMTTPVALPAVPDQTISSPAATATPAWGATPVPQASQEPTAAEHEAGYGGAEELARRLEVLAFRARQGQLSIDGEVGSLSDEAILARVLAAMLSAPEGGTGA